MRNFLNVPKIQLALCLLAIFFAVLFINFSWQTIILFALVLVSGITSDFLFLKIRRKNLFFPSAAIVTSLIIVLLTNPNLPIYIPVLTAIAAMFTKNFIRFPRHIFNPAASGLLLTSLIFGVAISWWGPGSLFPTTLQALPLFLILFLPFLVSAMRMRKYFIILSFLLTYSALTLILFSNSISELLTDPVLIFFSGVMLPEPMTTPTSRKNQMLFGVFVGLFAVLSSPLFSKLPFLSTLDSFIFSLLLANLVFFKRR